MLAATAIPAHALGEDIQCVPYARQLSGIQIYGDAHTWWAQADGRYARGNAPQVGAVLAFRPHGNMRLGHVAAVSKLVDARTILFSHSNWSTINGERGHVEKNVKVVDVSKRNDWSEVRVWYTPINALGGTHWPTYGFIYPGTAPRGAPIMVADAKPAKPVQAKRPTPARGPSRDLLAQIDGDWVKRAAARAQIRPAPRPEVQRPAPAQAQRPVPANSRNLPAGYTPSTYARTAYGEPNSMTDLLKRY